MMGMTWSIFSSPSSRPRGRDVALPQEVIEELDALVDLLVGDALELQRVHVPLHVDVGVDVGARTARVLEEHADAREDVRNLALALAFLRLDLFGEVPHRIPESSEVALVLREDLVRRVENLVVLHDDGRSEGGGRESEGGKEDGDARGEVTTRGARVAIVNAFHVSVGRNI